MSHPTFDVFRPSPRSPSALYKEYSQTYTCEDDTKSMAIARRWAVEGKCNHVIVHVCRRCRANTARAKSVCPAMQKSNTCSRPTSCRYTPDSVTPTVGCRFSYTLPSLESSRPRRVPGRRRLEPQQQENINQNDDGVDASDDEVDIPAATHSSGSNISLEASRRLAPLSLIHI